jgi:hypothetical protein
MDYNRFDMPSTGTITIVTGGTYQTPTGYSWTTPTLKGKYILKWGVTLDRANSAGLKYVRLYNVTDTQVLQNTFSVTPPDNTTFSAFNEEKIIEFLNATKTFRLEFTTALNTRIVGYRGFFIELMRVQTETA